jgi:hypothetical protein
MSSVDDGVRNLGESQKEYGPKRPQATTAARARSMALTAIEPGSRLPAPGVDDGGEDHHHGQTGGGQRGEHHGDTGGGGQDQPEGAEQLHCPDEPHDAGRESAAHGRLLASFSWGWVDFMSPAIPNTAASSPCRIHRTTFICTLQRKVEDCLMFEA